MVDFEQHRTALNSQQLAADPPGDDSIPVVGLSNSSVYPESTPYTFELASELGYDGVEVVVGADAPSTDVDQLLRLRDFHQVDVLSVHAPCLVITQRVWGADPLEKLERSAQAAQRLGAQVVVVHPPFRWQRNYAANFAQNIRRIHEQTGIKLAVENMYPWRVPAGNRLGYLPHWDPTDQDYEHLTLDFSHASTALVKARDYVPAWGDRLAHIHLTDGRGATSDEHLLPGEGDQDSWAVLGEIAERGYDGAVILEVSTRKIPSRSQREAVLGDLLRQTRQTIRDARQRAAVQVN